MSRRYPFRQAGLTLVELMISMALGLLVVMAATALLLSARSGYLTQDDDALVQDAGRYAIETIGRAVRQAAYDNWDPSESPGFDEATFSPNIIGLDASSLKSTTAGIDSPKTTSVNGSDVLAVRFFGTNDGAMTNCAGFPVAAATAQDTADQSRGWSIFYVADDANGVPQLYCKYKGSSAWTAQAIVEGVESFQVLYGLDTDGDGLPNSFLTATAIEALDDGLTLVGATPAEKALDKNRKTNWKKVVVVKVALLMRGEHPSRTDALKAEYDLFGKDYSDANAANDRGVHIKEADMQQSVRNRLRKIFNATIQVRNLSAGRTT